jgi:hypothetical protein
MGARECWHPGQHYRQHYRRARRAREAPTASAFLTWCWWQRVSPGSGSSLHSKHFPRLRLFAREDVSLRACFALCSRACLAQRRDVSSGSLPSGFPHLMHWPAAMRMSVLFIKLGAFQPAFREIEVRDRFGGLNPVATAPARIHAGGRRDLRRGAGVCRRGAFWDQ